MYFAGVFVVFWVCRCWAGRGQELHPGVHRRQECDAGLWDAHGLQRRCECPKNLLSCPKCPFSKVFHEMPPPSPPSPGWWTLEKCSLMQLQTLHSKWFWALWISWEQESCPELWGCSFLVGSLILQGETWKILILGSLTPGKE